MLYKRGTCLYFDGGWRRNSRKRKNGANTVCCKYYRNPYDCGYRRGAAFSNF
ncbi:MAG: hypothetical protein E7550_06385 [Ruminococcaceae bacterium]|nr:hypothetical protein [Oscillospiraceae bacterium]